MVDISLPEESGFAEFVSQLIADTFSAVVASQVQQELQLATLLEAAILEPEAFAEMHVEGETVEERLALLFPTDQSNRPHAIFVGAKYEPGKEKLESPPFLRLLGLELGRSDMRISRDGSSYLNESGVGKVRQAVRLQLAEMHLSAFRQIASRGVPRVLIDSGHVKAKVTFQIIQDEEAPRPPVIVGVPGLVAWRRLLPGRIVVRQADERAPQTTDLKIDVFGEVEVAFKTIT